MTVNQNIISNDVSFKEVTSPNWPDVWNEKQWKLFKENNSWLDCKYGSFGCLNCASVKSLGPLKKQGVPISEEWSTHNIRCSESSNKETKPSSLRIKIMKHGDSRAYFLCSEIVKELNAKKLESKLSEVHARTDIETESIFRTVYEIAKCYRPYSDLPRLVELQILNGLNSGTILHSRFSATEIVNHIASDMKKKCFSYDLKFFKVFNSSRRSNNVEQKSSFSHLFQGFHSRNRTSFYFFDLVEFEGQGALITEKEKQKISNDLSVSTGCVFTRCYPVSYFFRHLFFIVQFASNCRNGNLSPEIEEMLQQHVLVYKKVRLLFTIMIPDEYHYNICG